MELQHLQQVEYLGLQAVFMQFHLTPLVIIQVLQKICYKKPLKVNRMPGLI